MDEQLWKKRKFNAITPNAENLEKLLAPPTVAERFAALGQSSESQLDAQKARPQAEHKVVVPYANVQAQLAAGQVPTLAPLVLPPAAPPKNPFMPPAAPPGPAGEFLPPNEFGVVMRQPFVLYDHQIEAVRWARMKETQDFHGIRGGLLSVGVGLGKTIISLNVIMSQWQPGQCATLCVMPKTLQTNYLLDIGKFFGNTVRALVWERDELGDLFYHFTSQTPYKNHIVIVSYDTVLALAKAAGILEKAAKGNAKLVSVAHAFFSAPWFRVVCDESHKFANSTTLLWDALMKLPRGRRLCMTGTAVRNYEYDLFAQLVFCGLNVLPTRRQWNIETYKRLSLRDAVFCKDENECNLNLPELKVQIHNVELSQFEKRIYNIFMAKSTASMAQFKCKETNFSAVLETFTRLRQVCVAPHLVAPQSKVKKLTDKERDRLVDGSILGPEHVELERLLRSPNGPSGFESGKMRAMLAIASAIPADEKLIVFSQWSGVVRLAADVLRRRFGPDSVVFVDGEEKDNRDALFARFRLDATARFLCMTAVGSVGLTLVEANHLIKMEPDFSELPLTQASGRIHRIGQKRVSFVWQLIVQGSVEMKMLTLLEKKANIRDIMLEKGVNSEVLEEVLGEAFDLEA